MAGNVSEIPCGEELKQGFRLYDLLGPMFASLAFSIKRVAAEIVPSCGLKKKKNVEKCGFIEKAQEHRCDSLAGLLAIVCSDSSNGKYDRLGKRDRM